jgi:drug/metabolite transporter (DMT)-like permease
MGVYIFALISYFAWGAGVFFEAIVARRLPPYSLLFWSLLVSFLLSTLYLPYAIPYLSGYTAGLLVINIVLTFGCIGIGSLLYYEALRIENRALVGTIASSFPITSVLLSVLFLGERITLIKGMAILLIFAGLLLSGTDWQGVTKKKFSLTKGVLLAFITMLLWGIYFAFIKLVVQKVGWFLPNYVYFFMFPFIYMYLKVRRIKLAIPTGTNVWIPLIASTVLVRVAEFSYNLGIRKGLVSIVAPIAGANPTFFVVLAFLLLKDPVKKQQLWGIGLALAGIVALGFVT